MSTIELTTAAPKKVRLYQVKMQMSIYPITYVQATDEESAARKAIKRFDDAEQTIVSRLPVSMHGLAEYNYRVLSIEEDVI